ncbi:bifunctional UDP-N-acetylglucosamine diphosphorylase/glucosamine-1-phosphate N-acetyltransferase GlmU [Gordonia sp. ABSL49_1]|uniref:bifunctional UDP-N-acetylglucosamine diphosphorylase/glucosamine-1-phosphate N-acetyltransferase GlmU n=1 Tax=Gordonia sp. ABSL49_1 TaxID=2920941 RepID=UPI001F0D18D8|nr:bifunctional UDP-N-acetylglucosamine diphosphorylase/glucosamine-1-phosphate N-acetyltransferase GlmU [Gordonia sp. ABSL49_1]MCH5642004.1 bifunctional UDP-N-acetylglucosamine diphosphorylase/glucosamine-1-phosphate N-acetyltransferase GlmU [Gordonia sp. ABSL49_1]
MTATTSPVAVIVLAAGAGTRMKSKTPKILHTIAGRSLVGHVLHAAAGIGPSDVVAVVGHEGDRVANAVDTAVVHLDLPYVTAWQQAPLGTGDAARVGLEALPADFDGIVIVTAADVPLLDADTLRGLVATHTAGDNPAVVTLTSFIADEPTGYGRIIRTNDGSVQAIVEEKDATDAQRAITEVNAGIYAFDVNTLRAALAQLSTGNAQGEFYLTDVVEIARRGGHPVRAFTVTDPVVVAGCNDRVQLADLAAEFNRRIIRRHQLAGVTVVDPATTWIDVDVTIEADVRIDPGTQLHGYTRIDTDAVIGPDTTLTDVSIGKGAHVIRTHGSSAVIGNGASVGPFAYLRPGTELGADGKIGTFVETKNASIGTGSKVPHLTYVGDATIGEQSNVGASSVFVNYDGVTKHHTTIGSHCRTGSDNMFVAPVNVGDGAYTGAGTVVRHDVPPGALAVSAGEQRNIEDWVVRKRPDTPAARAARTARQQPTE